MGDGLQSREVSFSEESLSCDADWPASLRYIP